MLLSTYLLISFEIENVEAFCLMIWVWASRSLSHLLHLKLTGHFFRTITALALIRSDLSGAGVIDPPDEVNSKYTDACLIVCPVSVIANWKEQIRAHVGPSSVCNYHVYHGKDVKVKLRLLKSCDVVITSYTTLANEYVVDEDGNPISKKAKKPKADEKLENGKLFKIPWRRIILDEGHIIRNHKTRAFRSCKALIGERRWSVSSHQ